ncbi:unnamed protein product [Durusdinium trenchii]|uniref:Lipid desaturase domain-containing protein n=1 Tax=Durusdinium trenchii TaxID=1381693 RepID=A0ABP0MQD6_9DINO
MAAVTVPSLSPLQREALQRTPQLRRHRGTQRSFRAEGAAWPTGQQRLCQGLLRAALLARLGHRLQSCSQSRTPRPRSCRRAVARRPPSQGEAEYFKPLVEGDVLSASLRQRCIVGSMFVLLSLGLAKVALLSGSCAAPQVLLYACAVVAGVEFADFGTGVYHFSVDNYGSAQTPIVGSQIEAFQGHHEEPWTITYRDFCNNCFPTCIATMPFLLGFELFCPSPVVLLWAIVACAGIAFCQEFHKWSHTLRSQCHPVINWLQDRGILVHRSAHLRHHKPPFETNYCIVTGHMNPILDRSGFFTHLAALITRITGVKPRCETGDRFNYLLDRRE